MTDKELLQLYQKRVRNMNKGNDEEQFLDNREKLIFGYKPSEWL